MKSIVYLTAILAAIVVVALVTAQLFVVRGGTVFVHTQTTVLVGGQK